jgi:hypothetical protein
MAEWDADEALATQTGQTDQYGKPASYTAANGNTVRPLGDIEDEAFALVNSLDDTQKQAAVLGDTPIDLVLGPGETARRSRARGSSSRR